jgi:predicted metal-binding membrane protein
VDGDDGRDDAPLLAPAALLYVAEATRRRLARAVLFLAGYLLVWSLAGLAAHTTYAIGKPRFGSELAWPAGGRWLAAGMLALAALYQLTPVKHACLRRCRDPLRLFSGPPDGALGALASGARTGGWCIGSSWALMVALFALGVMSIVWTALIAALVGLEKLAPWRRVPVLLIAGTMLVLAVGLLLAPHHVPGLVVSHGTPGTMQPANSMGR